MAKNRSAQSTPRSAVFNLLKNHNAFVIYIKKKKNTTLLAELLVHFQPCSTSTVLFFLFLSYKTHQQKTKCPTRGTSLRESGDVPQCPFSTERQMALGIKGHLIPSKIFETVLTFKKKISKRAARVSSHANHS